MAAPNSRGRPTRLQVHAAISAVSFAAYILGKALPDSTLATAFVLAGVGSCGWAWLLTRALFDPAPRDAVWPRVVVGLVWVTGMIAILADPHTVVGSIADNAYALTGSAALLMTFMEPLHGFRKSLARPERGFRIAFLSVFALLVAMSILLIGGPTPGGLSPDVIRGLCATGSLVAVAAAVRFRMRHPLPAPGAPEAREVTDDHHRLAAKVLEAVRDEALYANPDLKLTDLARRLGEPEHRVTRSISAASGFANFNRLINHHRVERAKQMLADPARQRTSILVIAYDCGFASLGPFNRAFKAATGLVPREWRARKAATDLQAPVSPA